MKTLQGDSYSSGSNNCVAATLIPTGTLVRDTKRPRGGDIAVPTRAWQRLLEDLR